MKQFFENYPLTVLVLIIAILLPGVASVTSQYKQSKLAECQQRGNSFTECQKLFN